MADTPRISESEWLVMQVLWEGSPRTALEVAEALFERTRWSDWPATVIAGRRRQLDLCT